MSNKTPAERLQDLVGFDPTKKPGMTESVLKSVLEEVNAERDKQAKEKARELIKQALEVREQMVKAERDFAAAKSKFDKELGKLLNRLEGGSSDTEAAEHQQQ